MLKASRFDPTIKRYTEALYHRVKITSGAAVGLGLALFCMPTVALAGDVTIAVWNTPLGEVQKTAVVEPFKKESKLDVITQGRDPGNGILRTLVESGANAPDVTILEEVEALQGCEAGDLKKLDKSKIKGIADFEIRGDGFDCAVPFVIYRSILAYDKKAIKGGEPTSWADFFDLKKWPGKRGMNRQPEDTLEIALLADGVPRQDVYKVLATPAGLDRAFKKLDTIKSNIVWWRNPGAARQLLASGEIVMLASYDNGLRFFNKTQGTNFGFATKDAINHVDYWAILANSKHVDNAYTFLSFTAKPEIEAAVANGLVISVPNKKAVSLISSDLRPVLTMENFKNNLNVDVKFWLNNEDEIAKKFDAWAARP